MSSAKIVVLSLKEIIRVMLFVIFGVFIVCLLVFLCSPNSESVSKNIDTKAVSKPLYKDGEYTSKLTIDKGESFVQVTVSNDNIVDVKIINQDDIAKSFYPLLQTVCTEINNKLSSENSIVIETDYTNQVTTYVVTNAINDALTTAIK